MERSGPGLGTMNDSDSHTEGNPGWIRAFQTASCKFYNGASGVFLRCGGGGVLKIWGPLPTCPLKLPLPDLGSPGLSVLCVTLYGGLPGLFIY